MKFIRIANEFYSADSIVSAKLTYVAGMVMDGGYERQTEFNVFTLYGADGKVLGTFGGPETKSPSPLAGLHAFNEFASQVAPRAKLWRFKDHKPLKRK